mmetsp:Transcript_20767/g.52578  ORF Transcript_20767/g.52578 Transcript_20767/m.52578 type:complete len:333 (-) Transcript_20767:816-1814(-)
MHHCTCSDVHAVVSAQERVVLPALVWRGGVPHPNVIQGIDLWDSGSKSPRAALKHVLPEARIGVCLACLFDCCSGVTRIDGPTTVAVKALLQAVVDDGLARRSQQGHQARLHLTRVGGIVVDEARPVVDFQQRPRQARVSLPRYGIVVVGRVGSGKGGRGALPEEHIPCGARRGKVVYCRQARISRDRILLIRRLLIENAVEQALWDIPVVMGVFRVTEHVAEPAANPVGRAGDFTHNKKVLLSERERVRTGLRGKVSHEILRNMLSGINSEAINVCIRNPVHVQQRVDLLKVPIASVVVKHATDKVTIYRHWVVSARIGVAICAASAEKCL